MSSNAKYFYKGLSLRDYCNLHKEYNYNTISGYIKRERKKYPNKSIEEIINSYFEKEHITHESHFVDGIPLTLYCEKNGIRYGTIRSNLSTYRKDERYAHLSENERLKLVLKNYKNRSDTFLFYKGKSLYQYCKENDYLYSSVYNCVMRMLEENEEMSLDDAIESTLKNIRKGNILYYYEGIPLVLYCENSGLNVKRVREKILNIMRNENISLEDAVKEAVKYYERKKYFQNLSKIFAYLKNNDIDEEVLKTIVLYLNIDSDNISYLKCFISDIFKIVSIIWFLHDNKEGEKLSVSEERLRYILDIVNALPNMTLEEIKSLDFSILIGIYKANLFDTRYFMILHEEALYYHFIHSISRNYGISIDKESRKDLVSEINVFLLNLINKNWNNDMGMIISYIAKSIEGFIKNYLSNYMNDAKVESLDDISNEESRACSDKEDVFGEEIFNILSSLEDVEKQFVIYKYEQCFSDEEIASFLNISLEELLLLQKRVLNILSDSDELKELMLKRVRTNI